MITVEFDMDEPLITVMDQTGEMEDVSAILLGERCFIRQWDEKSQSFQVIGMTAEMYYSLMKSFNLSEGAWQIEYEKT